MCKIFTVVVAVILVLQLMLLLVARPYTTIFSHHYAVVVLMLTTLSVVTQLAFLLSTAQLDSWLLQGSAVCNIATVGLGLLKTLLDFVQLVKAVVRRARATYLLLRSTTVPRPPVAPVGKDPLNKVPLQEEAAAERSDVESREASNISDTIDEVRWTFADT